MSKQILMNPNDLRKKGSIKFTDIPVNTYDKTLDEEKKLYSKDDFIRIYTHMRIIREFESMLQLIKTTGAYNGIEYNHPGPAHLSLGQEASAVGQAYLLDIDDHIFGSHRSHGEILAKGLSAINKLDAKNIEKIMKEFFGGLTLGVVEPLNKTGDTKDLAVDFLIYGALAEVFARSTGFNKGLGGSMHAFFIPFGIYPNNAIVGGAAGIAVGAALYKQVNSKPGIVISNVGDGSLGCGPVWEAMMMATMDQYKNLWEGEHKKGLPIIFNFFNNLYGMGGQTIGETMGYQTLARIGAGINPDQMHSERIDGYNPLAVIEAMKRKIEIVKKGNGPAMLDTLTYRMSGHSPSDASSYRTKEEMDMWAEADVIKNFRKKLVDGKIASDSDIDKIDNSIVERITKLCRVAADTEKSPYMDLKKNPREIEDLMFSNLSIEKMEDRKCDTLMTKEENPRVKQLKTKERYAFDKDGKAVSKNKVYQLRDGIFEAIIDKFYQDPTLIAYGEDNRDWGGAFAVYRGLTEALPYHRFFNSPISEAAIVASAIGYAMSGGRVIAELMYCDFLGRAGDEIFNQIPKWQAMSAGILKMPVVIRVSVGSKYGAQHSQDWSSLVAHIPGIKVVFPATAYDAKGLMNTALAGTDPVVFFESQRIYDVGEQFHKEGVPEGYYEIPIGEPDIKREGKDITIVSIGASLYPAINAADELQNKYNVSAEVIDARSLVPFDYSIVIESVKKTGFVLLVSDACERGSYLKDISSNITSLAFDYLDAPAVVVGSRNWITPAFELESDFFPQPSWIIDAVHEKMFPLKGHVPLNNFTDMEFMRRSKLGV